MPAAVGVTVVGWRVGVTLASIVIGLSSVVRSVASKSTAYLKCHIPVIIILIPLTHSVKLISTLYYSALIHPILYSTLYTTSTLTTITHNVETSSK
jgi:hypothetical protein